MNLPARYWAPDENAEIGKELTYEDRLWCVRRIEPNWCLYWPTVDDAFSALQYRDEMAKLIEEVDEDNREAEFLDCGETLADVIEGIALLPALARRQCG